MSRMGLAGLVAAVLIVAAVSVGCASVPGASYATPVVTAASCANDPHALIDPSALPDFSVLVRGRDTAATGHGALNKAGAAAQDARDRDYLGGSFGGFLANVAINGPDRPDLDARATALNYAVKDTPYLPLVGDVVIHNAGLLELYESVVEYRPGSGLSLDVNSFNASLRQSGAKETIVAGLPPDAIAFLRHPEADDGYHEQFLYVELARGTFILRLTFQGGRSITMSHDVPRLFNEAVAAIQQTCGDAFPEVGNAQ